jgi:hypothetical protein
LQHYHSWHESELNFLEDDSSKLLVDHANRKSLTSPANSHRAQPVIYPNISVLISQGN